MPKDMIADTKIEAAAGKPVELPSGNFVANAEMTRSGMDLHLTSPDGHTIVVEGYFAQQPPPDLITHDGARMTPQLVNAFLPPEHAGQYAASGQIANDAGPAGKITQVVGEAHIIRADGTHVVATAGTPVYQGDVIETSKTGAVNIQFADNTTFAISESARMSVDQFVYHAADHTGSTFFSMLQGVFVYTSGLIGKTDAGSVNIETPVGSIGIRGTVVAGHILPAGQSSQITIVDGAITLTNGSGTQELNTSLATVSLNGYQSQPETVPMDANTFNNSYHAISAVTGDTLSHFAGAVPAPNADHAPAGTTAPAPATGNGTTAAPATTAPPPVTHAPASGNAAPAPATAPDSATQVTAPASGTSDSASTAATFTPPPATSNTAATTAAPPPATDTTTAPPATTAPPPATTAPPLSLLQLQAVTDAAADANGAAQTAATNAATLHTDAIAAANNSATAQAAANAAAAYSSTDPTDAAAAQTAANAAATAATTAHNADVDAAAQAALASTAATNAAHALVAAQAATDATSAQTAVAAAASYDAAAQTAAAAVVADLSSAATAATTAATDLTAAQASQSLVAAAVTAALSASVSAASASVTAADSAATTAATNAATTHADALTAAADSTAAATAAASAATYASYDTTDSSAAQAAAASAAAAATTAHNADVAAAAQATAANTAYANAETSLAAAQAAQTASNPTAAAAAAANAAAYYTAAQTAENTVAVDLANAAAAATTAATQEAQAQTSQGLVISATMAAAVTAAEASVASAYTALQNATSYENNAHASYVTASNNATTVSNAYTAIQSETGAFSADITTLHNANTSAQTALTSATAANSDASTQLSNAQAAYDAAETALGQATAASTATAALAAAATAASDATAAANAATSANTDMTTASSDASTSATDVTTATAFRLDSVFSTAYTNGTPGTTLDDGVKEFAAVGTVVAHVAPVNSGADNITYAVTVTNSSSVFDSLPGYSEQPVSTAANAVFSINSSGNLVVNDPLALSGYFDTSGIMINIAATDTTTSTTVNEQLLIQVHNELSLTAFSGEVYAPLVESANYTGTSGTEFIIGTGATAGLVLSDGGYSGDVILGNNYGDTIQISNSNFQYINGGAGLNTLQLTSTAPQTWDFTNGSIPGTVTNIQDINLTTPGSTIVLDNQSVYNISNAANLYTLFVDTTGSVVIDNNLGTSDLSYAGILSGGVVGSSMEFTGTYNGNDVTLLVQPDASTGADFTAGTIGTVVALNSDYTSPALASGEEIGTSVGISGNNVIVGGPLDNNEQGVVYVTNTATNTTDSIIGPAAFSYFGSSVAISGDMAVVGAYGVSSGEGAAYIYTIENNAVGGTPITIDTSSMSLTSTAQFGFSGISTDGSDILIGAWAGQTTSHIGEVGLFDSSGNYEATLEALTPATDDKFGSSTAVSNNTIVVGAYGTNSETGAAYGFNAAGGSEYALGGDTGAITGGQFGYSVATNGNIIVVGAPSETAGGATGAGNVYVYENGSTTPTFILHDPGIASTPATGDGFGTSVAISGNDIIVGAPGPSSGYAGEAYVYNDLTGQLVATLSNPNAANEQFGSSVGISGNTFVIGAQDDTSSDTGAAYTYTSATTGAQVTVEGADAGSYTAFQVSAFEGKNSVVGTLGPAADTYTITGGDTGYNHLVYAGGYTTTVGSDATPIFSVVGNQIVVNDATALDYNLNQSFTLNIENTTTSTTTSVSVLVNDAFNGVTPSSELMDSTVGGSVFFGTANNQMIWGGTGTTGDTLSDGGAGTYTGDALIGSNAGDNIIRVSNSSFAYVDGGTGGNDTLELYTSGSTFNIDFTSLNTNAIRNIDTINLGVSGGGGGNSVTLNAQDVFDMTNSADNHTLQISQAGVSGSAVNIVTSNSNTALDFTQSSGTVGTTQTFQGSFNGTNVTLVIFDQATSGTGHIAVNHVA